MAGEVDELDINPFYNALQTNYLQLHEKAQENCHIICVPQTSSLSGYNINQTFVETHILKPSPYFKEQYLTTNYGGSKTLYLDGNAFWTCDGFPEETTVKIINEELGYNKDFKPFKIFIIEKPFGHKAVKKGKPQSNTPDTLVPKTTLSECESYLRSFPEYKQVLLTLDETISKFVDNYMILKEYLNDAQTRVETMCQDATEAFLKCTSHQLWSDSRFKDILGSATESYVVGHVHKKIFPIICERFQDKELQSKYKQVSKTNGKNLGLDPVFICPLPNAVTEIQNLTSYRTSTEKLMCLKHTLDHITNTVNSHVRQSPQSKLHQEHFPCLTSDDLIPILVMVVSQAKCLHVESDVYFMENFTWSASTKDKDNLSYCLVTFKAAIHYMNTTDFSQSHQGVNATSPPQKTIHEFAESSKRHAISNDYGPDAVRPSRTHSSSNVDQSFSSRQQADESTASRTDRQQTRINRLLEDSSAQWQRNEKPKVIRSVFGGESEPADFGAGSNSIASQAKEPLGDFLSSLNDDFLGESCGKQS